MKRLYQFRTSFDNVVEVTVDDQEKTIVITKGDVKTREDFLAIAKDNFLLALIHQVKLHLDGVNECVDPDAYDILVELSSGDLEKAENIALDMFHQWDNYKILKALQ